MCVLVFCVCNGAREQNTAIVLHFDTNTARVLQSGQCVAKNIMSVLVSGFCFFVLLQLMVIIVKTLQ